jgi:hypothetical protein
MNEKEFLMSAVRDCFPAYGNPVVQDWIGKGFVSYGRLQRGEGADHFCFSLPEIVHIGVVGQFSTFGVLKNLKSAKLWREVGTVGKERLEPCSLENPTEIISYYESHNFHVGIKIQARQRQKNPLGLKRDRRIKRADTSFTITFMRLADLHTELSDWSRADGGNQENYFNLLSVSVLAIWKHVSFFLKGPY